MMYVIVPSLLNKYLLYLLKPTGIAQYYFLVVIKGLGCFIVIVLFIVWLFIPVFDHTTIVIVVFFFVKAKRG